MQLQTTSVTLTPSDVYGLSTPYELLPPITNSEFYDIEKIVWKLLYNITPYYYHGDLYFCIGDEHIATFQEDSITSPYSVATITKSQLCKDLCSSLILPGYTLTLQCTHPSVCRQSGAMSAPIEGDSNIEIIIDYYVHPI